MKKAVLLAIIFLSFTVSARAQLDKTDGELRAALKTGLGAETMIAQTPPTNHVYHFLGFGAAKTDINECQADADVIVTAAGAGMRRHPGVGYITAKVIVPKIKTDNCHVDLNSDAAFGRKALVCSTCSADGCQMAIDGYKQAKGIILAYSINTAACSADILTLGEEKPAPLPSVQ